MQISSAQENVQFSAVIPTHNRGPLIARAIESVLQQTWLPSEVIVIDDGSTDDTEERVARFGDKVRYIRQANAGASAARNRGVAEAGSEWVAFLDSDDVWLELHLERMARAIRATGGAARYYFADMITTSTQGEQSLWRMLDFQIVGEYQLKTDGTPWVLRSWPPMMLQSSVFSRLAYLESGGLWERLRTCHDTHLFIKLGLGGPICAVAGYGARRTADAEPDSRLTAGMDQTIEGGWQRMMMHKNLLETVPGLDPAARGELARRLANSHRRLAKLNWAEGRPWAAARYFARGMILDPRFCSRRLKRSLSAAQQGSAT